MTGTRGPAAVVVAIVLALVAGCHREKDPYENWRAPALLEEGERLLRAGDIESADKVFHRGLTRAEKDSARPEQTRVFLTRLLFIAGKRENAAEMQKLFERMTKDAGPLAVDPRAAAQLAVLLERAGKPAEARAITERLAARLAAKPPELDEQAIYLAGWTLVDRARTENVEINHAKEASDAFLAMMNRIAETLIPPRRPLPPGVRQWIARYVDHLSDSDRSIPAKQVADLVERIDEVAAEEDDKKACLPLDPMFPALGCLAEWPAKAGS